uniref:Uncharacterized protein n=1 Tax=Picea sitchensis TaxID=3332 RepID=A9NUU6_PICSI|nr:unknown [Picea sitchensis]
MLHFFNGSKASCIYPLDACCLFNHNFYWNFPIILRNGVRTGALSGYEFPQYGYVVAG